MIVLDIETSGLTSKHGIFEICALEIIRKENNPNYDGNYFFQEARIDDEDEIDPYALMVNGKTEKEIRDKRKQSQKQLIKNYFDWIKQRDEKIFYGINIGYDIKVMIQQKCLKYNLHDEFMREHGYKGHNISTLAQEKYFGIHGKYLLKEEGTDAMNLNNVLKFCGIPSENRKYVSKSRKEIIGQENHDSFNDCRFEAEALSRLISGKNLFHEFSKYEIPDYLKK